MRESFVFHAEYIQDVPEELQPVYAMYAINYALKDIEPSFSDWRDIRDWNKVKTRIDVDCAQWEEVKTQRSEAGKKHSGNQYTRRKTEQMEQRSNPLEQMEQRSNCSNPMERNGTNGTVSVSVSEYVSVNESEYVSVSEPPRTTLAEIRGILDENGFPCGKTVENFEASDADLAATKLRERQDMEGVSWTDVKDAVANYVLVVNDPGCYPSAQITFDKIVSLKNFRDYLPVNFRHENFIDFSGQKKTAPPRKGTKDPPLPDVCPKCGKSNVTKKLWSPGCYAVLCPDCGAWAEHGKDGWSWQ